MLSFRCLPGLTEKALLSVTLRHYPVCPGSLQVCRPEFQFMAMRAIRAPVQPLASPSCLQSLTGDASKPDKCEVCPVSSPDPKSVPLSQCRDNLPLQAVGCAQCLLRFRKLSCHEHYFPVLHGIEVRLQSNFNLLVSVCRVYRFYPPDAAPSESAASGNWGTRGIKPRPQAPSISARWPRLSPHCARSR